MSPRFAPLPPTSATEPRSTSARLTVSGAALSTTASLSSWVEEAVRRIPDRIDARSPSASRGRGTPHRPEASRTIAQAYPQYERSYRFQPAQTTAAVGLRDRKSTRLNSSHLVISYAVF